MGRFDVTGVRALTMDDFPAARALYIALNGHAPVPGDADGAARFAAIINHPGTTLFGAEAAGTIAAMVTLHILPNMTYGGRPYGLVENVVTLPSHRGRGLGRKTMQAAMAAAWDADAYKIMLLTGRDAGARGFYEALGFSAGEKYGMTARRAPVRPPR